VKKQVEEHYWSRFTSSYDREGEYVVGRRILQLIDNPLQCVRESHRILRNRGSLIVVDFTGYRLGLGKKMKLGFRYLRTWGLPPRGGRNNMTPGELVSLVEPVGFRVEHVELLVDGANALYLKGIK
jgi:ubiquinone/menaquinone biosynthesis C-methylase UbiE